MRMMWSWWMIVAVIGACLVPVTPARGGAPEVTPLASVQVRGEGPVAMVLIPGLSCDWRVWEAFMERNGARYTMYAVTLPGFGGSAAPPRPAGEGLGGTPWLDNAVAAVARMIRQRDLDRPVVVGHSLGGVVAYRLGIEHAELVRAAVSVDGLAALPLGETPMSRKEREGLVDAVIWPAFRDLNESAWREQQSSLIRSMLSDADRAEAVIAMARETPVEVGGRYAAELYRTDLTEALRVARTPTLALAGLKSPMLAPDEVRAIWTRQTQGAQRVRVSWMEGCGHFVMDDCPEAMDEALSAFVGSLNAAPNP